MNEILPPLIFAAGIGQLSILIASSLVPFQLSWKNELAGLPKLHRQMYVIYGAYIVLAILALGITSLMCSVELASGSLLARAFCTYAALFWGIRLALQAVLDVKPYLSQWWLKVGYHTLTILFACITLVFAYAALAER